MSIKLNVKYEWYSENKIVFHILNHFKKNNRKVKKCLKIALKDISNTLRIYEWDIIIEIRQWGYIDGITQYLTDIRIKSKIDNINGYLNFTDMQELLSKKEGWRARILNRFYYVHHDNSFYKNLVSDTHTILLMLNNFQENSAKVIDFPPIGNKEITHFKNKHEGFLRYIHDNNIYTFDIYNNTCSLQLFYVCDKIYWSCSYTLPDQNVHDDVGFTNVREIKEQDRNTFVLSMIEAELININQDIEEVLACDIKDIFAMSKLIGY